MAYRYMSERVTVTVAEGLDVEVQPISSDTVYRTAIGLAAACFTASPDAVSVAVERLVTYFCAEAQPTFDIVDHRGVVTPTPSGMLRLADTLIVDMVSLWAEQFVAEPAASAVDMLIPEGPMRDELNRRLKAA